MALTTYPHLEPRSKKEKSPASTPSLGLHGCSRVKFIFTLDFGIDARPTINFALLKYEKK
jgi:hypothetical protein